MSGVSLSYVNLVSEDIVLLSRFYSDLFDLEELPDFRSEMYVALDLDGVMMCCLSAACQRANATVVVTKR